MTDTSDQPAEGSADDLGFADVGQSFMEEYDRLYANGSLRGFTCLNSPVEVLVHLINERDEARALSSPSSVASEREALEAARDYVELDARNKKYPSAIETLAKIEAALSRSVEAGAVDDADKMRKISELIVDLQSILNRFGDTCVYIRRGGLSWGAVALNSRSDDEKHGVFDLQAQHDRDMLERLGQIERLKAARDEWRQKVWNADSSPPSLPADAVREALDNSQSLLAMIHQLNTNGSVSERDWETEGLSDLITKQITENRAALTPDAGRRE
jgi:hypothetical protein